MGSRKNGTDEPICRAGIETQTQRMGLWTQQGKGRVGERLKREGTYVYLWLIYLVVQKKPTQHCKAIILQLKIN